MTRLSRCSLMAAPVVLALLAASSCWTTVAVAASDRAARPHGADPASHPAAAAAPEIVWEVKNRFRLFREERDFLLHVEALSGRSILEAEHYLARQSDGRGWARNTVGRLCIDPTGVSSPRCKRDGVEENYLAPEDHAVTIRVTGLPADSQCIFRLDNGDGERQSAAACATGISARLRYGRPTVVTADHGVGDKAERLVTEILVRDLFVLGLGDSIAAGEGNPDRPVTLAKEGFCFRNFLSSTATQYFRPGRAGFTGGNACGITPDAAPQRLQAWQMKGAQWFNAACHRSLYSYQTRAAIALAVRDPHAAVTYLPLACTGATIPEGLLGAQRGRDCIATARGPQCVTKVAAQIEAARGALAAAQKSIPARQVDLVLLSIGANDMGFSNLVADIIIEGSTERGLFRSTGVIGSVEDSQKVLARELPASFAALRKALRPLLGNDLTRVVHVSYGHPALADGAPCPQSRDGFDIHPAFAVDGNRLAMVSDFVSRQFLPQLKALALCEGGTICSAPEQDRFTFVDSHQAAFAQHGYCARSADDPDFDRACFKTDGESFQSDPVNGAVQPMVCDRSPAEFRAYAPRARWIRTANDSYFAAMTYPQGLPSAMQPADIHDATWGILSAVYGGAIHPTAEGHAAMADAALAAAESVVGATPVTTTARGAVPPPGPPADDPAALPPAAPSVPSLADPTSVPPPAETPAQAPLPTQTPARGPLPADPARVAPSAVEPGAVETAPLPPPRAAAPAPRDPNKGLARPQPPGDIR